MTPKPLSFTHRFLPGEGPSASTTLLLLHGTGGTEDDLLGLGRAVLPGATLLSPRGKVLEHGMPRFFRRLAEGVFDLDDLHRRTHELAAFITEAAAAYALDPTRIIALGYSNGANIASSTLLLHPDTLSAAILLRPMVPFLPDTPPNLAGKRILLSAGRTDPIATPDHAHRLASMLTEYGADVATHWHPGGHQLGRDDLTAAHDWLELAWRPR